MKSNETLIKNVQDALQQGRELVLTISDTTYNTVPGALPKASTVGAHFRHVLEHVELLVNGLEAGIVNYDLRERDPRIEREREFAAAFAQRLCGRLAELDSARLDLDLVVIHHTCPKSDAHQARSSAARELMFVLSHTHHHWALIRLLVELHQGTVPAAFGFMPSTIRHHERKSGATQ